MNHKRILSMFLPLVLLWTSCRDGDGPEHQAANGTTGNNVVPTIIEDPSEEGETIFQRLWSLPNEFVGRWDGDVSQPGPNTDHYPLTLTIQRGNTGDSIGTSSYPTKNCTGKLVLDGMSTQRGRISVQEQFGDASSACTSTSLTLALFTDGTLRFDSENPSYKSGILKKAPPPPPPPPVALPPGTVLLADSLGAANSRFGPPKGLFNCLTGPAADGQHIIGDNGWCITSGAAPQFYNADVSISVQIIQLGPHDSFGIGVRRWGFFRISGDGTWRYTGDFVPDHGGSSPYLNEIKSGRMRILMKNSHMEFFFNGVKLGESDDATDQEPGQVRINSYGGHVVFSDLLVTPVD